MPQLIDLPVVAPTQVQTCTMDFGKFLPLGVTLQGAPSLTISVRLGTDNDPTSRINAGPIIGTAPTVVGGTGLTDTAVLFQVHNCLDGVTYLIEVHCDRSDGDVAEAWVRLACVAPL